MRHQVAIAIRDFMSTALGGSEPPEPPRKGDFLQNQAVQP